MKTIDKIKVAKHFGLDKSMMRCRALKLALWELEKIRPRKEYITRLLNRWDIRDAFAFYSSNKQAW